MSIRDAVPADIPRIAAIYAHYVEHTIASMALDVPSEEATLATFKALKAQGFPYVVFVVNDERKEDKETSSSSEEEVIGYAYARPYHDRRGYDKTAETSIYLDPGYTGQGQGPQLLGEVLARLEDDGDRRQLIAQISFASDVPDDEEAVRRASPSVALHTSAGFRMVGRLRKVGWKFERWVDVVVMQRELGRE